MVAALYVETGGCYFGLPDVDPWDEARDARLYAGPWPVVAHPPCAHWSVLAFLNQSRLPAYYVGDDRGCFEAALEAVERWGGVLEHPHRSVAWSRFGLPYPGRQGWTQTFDRPGFACEISQSAYGHRASKRTWLYYVGPDPPAMRWGDPPVTAIVSGFFHHPRGSYVADESRHVRTKEAQETPVAFRDALLDMARSAALDGTEDGPPRAENRDAVQ